MTLRHLGFQISEQLGCHDQGVGGLRGEGFRQVDAEMITRACSSSRSSRAFFASSAAMRRASGVSFAYRPRRRPSAPASRSNPPPLVRPPSLIQSLPPSSVFSSRTAFASLSTLILRREVSHVIQRDFRDFLEHCHIPYTSQGRTLVVRIRKGRR
jgi:hypothetical protein